MPRRAPLSRRLTTTRLVAPHGASPWAERPRCDGAAYRATSSGTPGSARAADHELSARPRGLHPTPGVVLVAELGPGPARSTGVVVRTGPYSIGSGGQTKYVTTPGRQDAAIIGDSRSTCGHPSGAVAERRERLVELITQSRGCAVSRGLFPATWLLDSERPYPRGPVRRVGERVFARPRWLGEARSRVDWRS